MYDGSFGAVWKGRLDGQLIAIKVMRILCKLEVDKAHKVLCLSLHVSLHLIIWL